MICVPMKLEAKIRNEHLFAALECFHQPSRIPEVPHSRYICDVTMVNKHLEFHLYANAFCVYLLANYISLYTKPSRPLH